MTTFTTEDRQAIDDGRARCGCGKSLHQPYCDGSHARNDQELKEWADRVELEKYIQACSKLTSKIFFSLNEGINLVEFFLLFKFKYFRFFISTSSSKMFISFSHVTE